MTTKLTVGQRVALVRDVERFSDFIVRKGAKGTVVTAQQGAYAVKMDDAVEGAEAWDNCIIWNEQYDTDIEGDLKAI